MQNGFAGLASYLRSICAALPFLSWVVWFVLETRPAIARVLTKAQADASIQADASVLEHSFWIASGIIVILLGAAVYVDWELRRTRRPKRPDPISERDSGILRRTSGLDRLCGRSEATALCACHVALTLAHASDEIAERIQHSIEDLDEEWRHTTDMGSPDLTPAMRKLSASKEAVCRLKGPSVLYYIGPLRPEIADFLKAADEIRAEFTRGTIDVLDEEGVTELSKHHRARANVARLVEKAALLRTRARDVAVGLTGEALEAQRVVAHENCRTAKAS